MINANVRIGPEEGGPGTEPSVPTAARTWWPWGRVPTRGQHRSMPLSSAQEYILFTVSPFLLLKIPVNPLSHYSMVLLFFLSAPSGGSSG